LYMKFKFNFQIWIILTEFADNTLQTGSKGLSNCRTSPTHLGLLSYVKNCFGS
jgi:hypothetical protein